MHLCIIIHVTFMAIDGDDIIKWENKIKGILNTDEDGKILFPKCMPYVFKILKRNKDNLLGNYVDTWMSVIKDERDPENTKKFKKLEQLLLPVKLPVIKGYLLVLTHRTFESNYDIRKFKFPQLLKQEFMTHALQGILISVNDEVYNNEELKYIASDSSYQYFEKFSICHFVTDLMYQNTHLNEILSNIMIIYFGINGINIMTANKVNKSSNYFDEMKNDYNLLLHHVSLALLDYYHNKSLYLHALLSKNTFDINISSFVQNIFKKDVKILLKQYLKIIKKPKEIHQSRWKSFKNIFQDL